MTQPACTTAKKFAEESTVEAGHGSARHKSLEDADDKCRFIQHTIATAHRVCFDDLMSPSRRKAPIAFARQVAMYLAHVSCGFTLTEVGRCFGRDRTTVAHACRLVEDERDREDVDLALDCLEAALLEQFAAQSRFVHR